MYFYIWLSVESSYRSEWNYFVNGMKILLTFTFCEMQKFVLICRMWKSSHSIFCVAKHYMILQPYHTRKSTTNAEAVCSKWKKETNFAKMHYTSSNPCKPFLDIKRCSMIFIENSIHGILHSKFACVFQR